MAISVPQVCGVSWADRGHASELTAPFGATMSSSCEIRYQSTMFCITLLVARELSGLIR